MDVTFVWTTGQNLGSRGGRSREHELKNGLSVVCDGEWVVVEAATSWMEEWEMSEVVGWMATRCVVTGGGGRVGGGGGGGGGGVARVGSEQSVERAAQEEEWGTGPTVVGAMPATFQAVVSKYLKMKHESKMVDLSRVARGARAGDVVGLHMRRSEMLVWLTYSVVAHGLAFLPLDVQNFLDVVVVRVEQTDFGLIVFADFAIFRVTLYDVPVFCAFASCCC